MPSANRTFKRYATNVNILGATTQVLRLHYVHDYVNTPGWYVLNPPPNSPRQLVVKQWGDSIPTQTSAGGTPTKSDSSLLVWGSIEPDSAPLLSLLADARRKAAAKRTKVGQVRVNVGQNVLEAKSVFRSIMDKMWRVAHARVALRQGRYGDVAVALGIERLSKSKTRKMKRKNVASQWLDLQYGWLPLLSDVHEATEMMFEPNSEPRFRVVLHGSANKSAPLSYTTVSPLAIREATEVYRASARYVYWLRLSDPALRERSQWGLTNPLLLAWELLPYSFIVDWFAPIGNYLEQVSSHDGFTFERGVLLEKSSATGVYRYTRSPAASGKQNSSGMTTCKVTNWTRTVLTGAPSSVFKGLKNPLSALHVANSVALLTMALKKSSR